MAKKKMRYGLPVDVEFLPGTFVELMSREIPRQKEASGRLIAMEDAGIDIKARIGDAPWHTRDPKVWDDWIEANRYDVDAEYAKYKASQA